MPMLFLVIGIGVADVAATMLAARGLSKGAEKEIAKGIEQIVENAPDIMQKAIEDFMSGNQNG